MAITVSLYTFKKRENSTKQPSGSGSEAATDYSCTLLDNTSLMNPTFKLSIANNPIGKNYCYVADFNRYYFISDISSYQNFWYISCKCDVLASFKSEIKEESHYVLRAASAYDEYISDSFYGAKVTQTNTLLTSSGPFWWATNHSFVVGIVGNASSNQYQVGSVTYYQMDQTALNDFVYFLMHDLGTYCNITTAPYTDPGVQEALINPIQYIVSCIALPVGFPQSFTQVTSIKFGYYSWSVTGSGQIRALQFGETATETNTFTLTKHPQSSTRGKFLNGAPFTDYTFHLGPFGDIPIDPAPYIDVEKLRYKVVYDLCQGMGRLAIGPANSDTQVTSLSNLSYCGTAKVGADVQLAQALTNPLQAQLSWETGMNNVLRTGVGSGLSLATPSNILGAQNTLQETYVDAIKNKFPTCCGKGSPGSFISFKDEDFGCYLNAKFMTIVDENLAEIGRPLCQVKTIKNLSGYILCQNADAKISGTADEAALVNSYLNSGFFYE